MFAASARRILLALTLLSLALCASPLHAQDDEPGKDHPLFGRMQGYVMGYYEQNYNEAQFPVSATKIEAMEGQVTNIRYGAGEGRTPASTLQIVRNFEQAVKKLGGTTVFDGVVTAEGEFQESRLYVAKVMKGGTEYWLRIWPFNGGADYDLLVLEKTGMAQEVQTGDVGEKLAREGRVTLYINFDTAKWDLKPEAKPTIEQIVKALKADPALKIRVEGHTDNQGQPEANKTLSVRRAESVRAAITASGVEAARVSATGLGQEEPVADNASEEGRAKNRRVEIVRR